MHGERLERLGELDPEEGHGDGCGMMHVDASGGGGSSAVCN
jgi:hypothetical protein